MTHLILQFQNGRHGFQNSELHRPSSSRQILFQGLYHRYSSTGKTIQDNCCWLAVHLLVKSTLYPSAKGFNSWLQKFLYSKVFHQFSSTPPHEKKIRRNFKDLSIYTKLSSILILNAKTLVLCSLFKFKNHICD